MRAFVGPVMAAMLWHLAMGIELRLHKPDAASHSLLATLGREARERLLSRLGIAARDRDAAQITRDRATTRAVTLATRLAEHTPAQRQKWRGRRLAHRLSKAVGRASVGTDPKQRAQLLDQLAARRHAHTLASIPLPSPWTTGHDEPAEPASATVPSPQAAHNTSVPSDGPRTDTEPVGDRTAGTERGPVPKSTSHSTGTDVGTGRGPVPESRDQDAGTKRYAGEMPAHTPQPHRGPKGTKSGTDPIGGGTGDRAGPTQGPGQARGPGVAGTGAMLARSPHGGSRRGRASESGPVRSRRRARRGDRRCRWSSSSPGSDPMFRRSWSGDGNETVNRVQLREILRNEGLRGGRNDRLGLVLQELRTKTTT